MDVRSIVQHENLACKHRVTAARTRCGGPNPGAPLVPIDPRPWVAQNISPSFPPLGRGFAEPDVQALGMCKPARCTGRPLVVTSYALAVTRRLGDELGACLLFLLRSGSRCVRSRAPRGARLFLHLPFAARIDLRGASLLAGRPRLAVTATGVARLRMPAHSISP